MLDLKKIIHTLLICYFLIGLSVIECTASRQELENAYNEHTQNLSQCTDYQQYNGKLSSEGSLEGLEIKLTGQEEALYYPNGVVAIIKLKVDTLWRNILFKKDTLLYVYQNGIVYSGTLARAEEILVWKHLIPFATNTKIKFFDNGTVSYGTVEKTMGLLPPYNFAIAQGSVRMFPTGAINHCVTNEGLKIGKYKTKPKSTVVFSNFLDEKERVSVQAAYFPTETRWGSYTAAKETKVYFYKGNSIENHGALHGLKPPTDVLLDQKLIAKGNNLLTFHENGMLRWLVLAVDMSYKNIALKTNTTNIQMHDNGELFTIRSSYDVTVNGLVFKPWKGPVFSREGKLTNKPW